MKLPTKIAPCPIVEAILEIQFESTFPEDAVFGIVYGSYEEEEIDLEKLPILQLPDEFRLKEPNLKYKPYYHIKKQNFIFGIGPKVFSIVNVDEYSGWDTFSKKIYETFDRMGKLKIVTKITRMALRYVNVFRDIDIYERSTLAMSLNDQPFGADQLNIVAQVSGENCLSRLKMVNNATVGVKEDHFEGSLVDIDTVSTKYPDTLSDDSIKEAVESAHVEEKKLFFSLLKPDFLQTLNPEY